MGKSEKFAWGRTYLVAALLAVVVFGAFVAPAVKPTLRRWKAQRLENIYASGLSPCDVHATNDLEPYLQRYVPGPATISIAEFPSFSNAHIVRIVGQDIYFIELNQPLYKWSPGSTQPSISYEKPPKILHSRLTSATIDELSGLFANDIANAKTELHTGLDGTGYKFWQSDVCARTWSPDPGSRAAKLIDIFYMLGKHAALSQPVQVAQSDRQIFNAARSLKVM